MPPVEGWMRHRIEISAARVDLEHLGVHTHANWIEFALPFDVSDPDIHNVRFVPYTLVASDVGSLAKTHACLPTLTLGGANSGRWAVYTSNALAGTRAFRDHVQAPPKGPRVYAINVPTRVANYADCFAPELREPHVWRLVVQWETRAHFDNAHASMR